jgi:hypothetical protein
VPGRYKVTLDVENSAGFVARATQTVLVHCSSEDVSPWAAVDIGSPAVRGGARREDDQLTLEVCAAGRFLSGRTDSVRFVFQELAGDGEVVATPSQWSGGTAGFQIGVMIRESLEPGARNAALTLRQSRVGAAVTLRLSSRDASEDLTGSQGIDNDEDFRDFQERNAVLRLERRGPTTVLASFRLLTSDEIPWRALGVIEFPEPLPETLLWGVVAIGAEPSGGGSFESLRARVFMPYVAEITTAPSFRRADANADGRLDLSDGVSTLEYLFLGESPPTCADAADANDDSSVDITDPIFTLGFLFVGSPAPSAPYPECGVDPTADDVDCAGVSGCE